MGVELQTRRLLLRPLELAPDSEQTQRLFPEWTIAKFLNSEVPWPYDDQMDAMTQILLRWHASPVHEVVYYDDRYQINPI